MSLFLAGLLALSGAAAAPSPAVDTNAAASHPVASAVEDSPEPPPTPEQRADQAAEQAAMRSLTLALRNSASPRERAFAAQLGFFDMVVEGRLSAPAEKAANGALLRAAAEAAPDDALIQSLWLQAEPEDSGCDAVHPCPNRSEALVRIEPDNVFAWFTVVDDAWKRRDVAATDLALARMAQATTYEDHQGEAQKAWMDVLARYPMPVPVADRDGAKYGPQAIAYTTALSLAIMMMPAFQPTAQACHSQLHPEASPQRFRDCAQIGRTMLGHSDSLMGRMLGRALLRVSGQATPADFEMARVTEWQHENWFQIALAMQDPAKLNAVVADWNRADNEIEVLQIEFKRAGIPLNPPKGWLPSDDHGKPVSPLGAAPEASKAR